MIKEEKLELIKGYEDDYFQRTGERIKVEWMASDSEKVTKYINSYIYRNRVFLDSKIKLAHEDAEKLHLLRWILKYKFFIPEREIGIYTKCDRTYVYKSLKVAQGLIDTEDCRFIKIFNLEMSNK